jgi:hypothetical protein
MPTIKIKRSKDSQVGVGSASLKDGELFWDKSTKTLNIGEEDSAGNVVVKKIQKQITVSSSAPTSTDTGNVGDIWIQYLP